MAQQLDENGLPVDGSNFNFVIARLWPKTSSLCVYAYGREVHSGTRDHAEALLEYVSTRKEDDSKEYRIVPIPLGPLAALAEEQSVEA